MGSSYYITYGGNRLTFPGATGSVAWEAPEPLQTFSIEFGEGNSYSAGLTAEYDGQIVYSSQVGTSKRTATGIPYGSVLTMSASSPKYYTFTIGTLSSVSASGDLTYDGQRDGIGASVTGILTGDGSFRLANGHTKTFRVQGNFPKPGAGGKYATVYCRPTEFSSWHGTGMVAGSKLNIRNSWTANMTSHCGNSWGAGGDVVAAGWQPRNCSSFSWSGWCDTTGKCYAVYGYLEWKAGFNTFGDHNSSQYIARSWGSTTQQNYFAAGRSATGSNAVITAINGYFWSTGIAP